MWDHWKMKKATKPPSATAGREVSSAGPSSDQKPWMRHAGKLKPWHKETERINKRIEEAFEKVDKGQWGPAN